MHYKLKLSMFLVLSVFLLNSCDLLNPFNDGNNKIVIPESDIMLSIERTPNSLQGQRETVEIIMENSDFPIGGFDLLITYDASALTFQTAEPGQFLTDCGWGYFTYRFNSNQIDSITFRHTIRINAIANIGHIPPTCYIPNDSSSNQLAVLNFLVTNDRTVECDYAPIQFYWEGCGDNMLGDIAGNQQFASENIYDKKDTMQIDYSHNLSEQLPYPTYTGYNSDCDTLGHPSKPDPIRNIDFINGGIDIACADSIDMRPCKRGDINYNGTAFEIADAVIYSNYFIYGLSVFTANIDCQIANSDVNADGIPLSVADLKYLIRVIVGDALPYPSQVVNEPTYVIAKYQHNDAGVISVEDYIYISAAHIVVEGEVTPTLLATDMTMLSNFDGINSRILVYSMDNKNFYGDMINVGNNEIVSLEMSDHLGNQVRANYIQQTYELGYNYPNPFNPTTTIPFSLPQDGYVTLDVYNSSGQKVASFSGEYEAGYHAIEWDATNFLSGYYHYTLRVNGFEDSKTMLKIG